MDAGESRSQEQGPRELTGVYSYIESGICFILTLCALYWVTIGVTQIIYQRSLFLMLVGVLCFMSYPFGRNSANRRFSVMDVVLVILLILSTCYVTYGFLDRVERLGMPNRGDLIFGTIVIVLCLEMVRRVLGKMLAAVAVSFVFYAYFGPYMPGFLVHKGFSLGQIINHVFSGMEGIYGIANGVMCTYVIIFIIFGAFLEKSGTGQFLINLSFALTKRGKGGPAKTAVVASGLMGSVSGSSIANVLTTGVFTIPMMKKIGYPSHEAGAIEAAASTGGQIMPPVMGAAVFVMVQFTGISYLDIIKAAAIPALLYYLGVYTLVHLVAVRNNYSVDKGLLAGEGSNQFNAKHLLRQDWHLMLPSVLLVIALLGGYSPMMAGFLGIVATVAASMVRRTTRMNFKTIIEAMILGARNSLAVGSIIGSIGIIIGIVGLTGVGLRFSDFIVELGRNNLFIAVCLIMLLAFILGMGLPTTPSYILLAIFAGPAMGNLGISLMAGHLFLIWHSASSDISPPVALAAYTASGLARSDPVKTALAAFKYAYGFWVIPFLFIYRPELLLMGSLWAIIETTIVVSVGIVAIAFCLEGSIVKKISVIERILYGSCSVLALSKGIISDAIGVATFACLLLYHILGIRRKSRQK